MAMSPLNNPVGFEEAIRVLNTLPLSVLSPVAYDVAAVVERKGVLPSAVQLSEKLDNVDSDQAQSALNALVYIFKEAAKQETGPDGLHDFLKAESELSESAIGCLSSIWAIKHLSMKKVATQEKTLSVGKLVEFEWKAGVMMDSSTAGSARTPFVSCVFHVSNGDGRVKASNVELSLEEFQELTDTMKNISTVLDSI